MRRQLLAVLGLGLLVSAGCGVGPPDGRQTLTLPSQTLGFVDELNQPEKALATDIGASLVLPKGPGGPYPAVVMLHAGSGQGMQDWFYARLLRDWGYAVLAIDSFSARGINGGVGNQLAVSEASFLRDAQAGLDFLSRHPQVDETRIALLGFSKGGLPALLAALERFQGGSPHRFAAHAAFYPWCGIRFKELELTGRPVLVISGGRDVITPAALCERLVGDLRDANPGADITFKVYEDAVHAFDHPHPLLDLVGELDIPGTVPANCFIEEKATDVFVEQTSGEQLGTSNFADVIQQ
ncbi:MAG: dienelactone hydrolase family protein, partial [Alphaproteobacteria bacterium]|nr:dienelactone hydrolase family protein [Alphaproteobacteria bacterium]